MSQVAKAGIRVVLKPSEAYLSQRQLTGYNNFTPEQRDRWKIHLTQRFEKSKGDVGSDEFK